MSSPEISLRSQTRPGGRTAEVSRRIYAATMALLVEGGFGAVTFQKVAEQAGVGRATLYRRWVAPSDLVREAIRANAAEKVIIPNSGVFRRDLALILRDIGQLLASPVGIASIIAGLAMDEGPVKGEQGYWAVRWTEVRPIFERALARGEISSVEAAETIFAALAGALYFRRIVMVLPIDDAWINDVLNTVLGQE